MAKIITVAMQKGGVSKTTTSVYLATMLSKYGKVLLKDADPTGSSSFWVMDIENPPFEWEVANTRTLGRTGDYDFVVIDTPTAGLDIFAKAISVADFVIIPSGATGLDYHGARATVDVVSSMNIEYRVLLACVRKQTNAYKTIRQFFADDGIPCFTHAIPTKVAIAATLGQIPKKKDEIEDYELFFEEFWSLLNSR